MRLEKYTYDDRKGGQVPCAAHALFANKGVPENACIFGVVTTVITKPAAAIPD